MFEDELDFGRYLRIFVRHRLLLAAGALLGVLAGAAVNMTRPVRYDAVTTLVAHSAPGVTPGADRTTFRALRENHTLASQIVDELGLNRPPHHLTPQQFVADALRVEEVAGSNQINVRAQLADPRLAMEASRRWARKAVALNKQIAGEAGSVVRTELKPHVDEAAERLKQAEVQLMAFQGKAQVDLLKTDTEAMLEERGNLLRLVVDIEGERARLATAERELQRHRPLLSAERSVKAEEALRRAIPRADATPEVLDLSNPVVNPVYQTLEFEIATSRARLAALERQRDELVRVRKLDAAQLKDLTVLYQRQIDLERLKADHELAQRVYSELALRYEQARSNQASGIASLQIIDEAIQPDRPMPRKRVQTIMLGLLCGLAAAALAAVVKESVASSEHGARG
jgi:uncharacterized protein involved in exopolysaccharide biosynthesis